MKIFLSIILIILTSFPAFSQRSLNVMSFNIRLDVSSDSLNNWKYRKDNLVSQVSFYETDILGVQEALQNQMEDLQQRLPAYRYAGVARDTNKLWGEYSAIFYDTSRLNLMEQNTFWLSENIHAMGVKGWDAALPRIVTWVKLKDKKIKKIFYVFNTHFDHKGEIARRESANLLLKQVAAIAGKSPVIVMGDFNARPLDEPIQIITDQTNPMHLTDSKEISKMPHYGPTGTFNGFKSSEIRDEPIDFIFVNDKIKVLKHATLSQTWKGRFASDHFAVFAEVVVGEM